MVNGLAWGARGPLITALRADYFGASQFGQIMGWSSTVMMLFMVAGSLIVGTLRDVSGDFMLGFLVVQHRGRIGCALDPCRHDRGFQAVAPFDHARHLTPGSAQLIVVSARPNRPGSG